MKLHIHADIYARHHRQPFADFSLPLRLVSSLGGRVEVFATFALLIGRGVRCTGGGIGDRNASAVQACIAGDEQIADRADLLFFQSAAAGLHGHRRGFQFRAAKAPFLHFIEHHAGLFDVVKT